MIALEKMQPLVEEARFDTCTACGEGFHRQRAPYDRWIYPTKLPDGRTIRMLRILQTNACMYDCFYCNNRAGRPVRRHFLEPEELSRGFMEMVWRGQVVGLFLSSGIVGVDETQDRLVQTVEILRERYGFWGYIHLKIMPGARADLIERAMQLADRVSINLEAPTPGHLSRLAGRKRGEELWSGVRQIAALVGREGIRADQTTQFVVGAAGESDFEILSATDRLYREYRLSRVYYSAFQPVPQTPLEEHPPTPLLREHRLYQADWLLRKYGFQLEELVFDGRGNLASSLDPKLVWALHHPERFPVEVNTAGYEELLRIPGIGPKTARRLLKARREGCRVNSLDDLRALGARAGHAAPFILINGKPMGRLHKAVQLSLVDGAEGAAFDEALIRLFSAAVAGRSSRKRLERFADEFPPAPPAPPGHRTIVHVSAPSRAVGERPGSVRGQSRGCPSCRAGCSACAR